MGRNEKVEFEDAVALVEREVSLLVKVGDDEVWIPKKLIHDDSEVFDAKNNSSGKLVIPRWLAEDRGLV